MLRADSKFHEQPPQMGVFIKHQPITGVSRMKLFTKVQYEQLLKNGKEQDGTKDFEPVVKLFTPDANCTWLISEIDPDNTDIAFGLCDLGMGFPEMGNVSISEISAVKGQLNLPIERDRSFDEL